MSQRSNNQGRGYEYACLCELYNAIKNVRPAEIVKNSSLEAAQRAYDTLTESEKETYSKSAKAMIPAIIDSEPRIVEDDQDVLSLFIQQDEEGEKGDVRDVIIARNTLKWEIGLSIKHNHFAVKHSRLSPTIDFGDKWFGVPCSQDYWNKVKPVFDYLEEAKQANKKFNELPNKDIQIYKPVIAAFIEEINRQYCKHADLPKKMVEYLLSKYDFYKVISVDSQRLTQVQAYNLHDSLNKPSKKQKPKIIIPVASLPTRIIKIDFYPGRNNTAELFMDNGWSFTFRIHNAETYATPTLKFDIQIKGMPTDILTINCIWK
ncbi:MAG: HaeIII family restriction endonuclease [Paludibacteraceae bacterium]